MREWDKVEMGYLYDANNDKGIIEDRIRCMDLCFEFNNCKPSEVSKQQKIMKKLFLKKKTVQKDNHKQHVE